MPQLRLVPEELEVTSFVSMLGRNSEQRELEAAYTQMGAYTCGYRSCVFYCPLTSTCPENCT